MTSALLATFDLMPHGEPGGELLVEALAERGVEARWVRWDDPEVDWTAADLVAVRSTWDYHRRLRDFLAWARAVESRTRLLNGAEVFAWNADKAYLVELGEHLPVVPTATLAGDAGSGLADGLRSALERWGTVVVKPRTGAGGVGLVVASSVEDPRLAELLAGPWIVQPLVESVRTTGESSVFVVEGSAITQVDKVAVGEEVRVHGRYGGSSRAVALDPDRARAAEAAVRQAAALRGADLAYARVDLVAWEGAWAVGELELIEPGLYLDVVPDLAAPFADLVARRAQRA